MVSALDFGSSGLGSRPGRGSALCSWARYFTLIVPLFTQHSPKLHQVSSRFELTPAITRRYNRTEIAADLHARY